MKDPKPLLLILLSAGLISTWVYHLYDKTQYSKHRNEIYVKDSVAVAQGVTDSLQKIYAVTLNSLDAKLDSSANSTDSLQSELGAKVLQIQNLKKEIGAILGKRGITKEELGIARQKINELQSMVDGLRKQNSTMEEERNRLNSILAQLNGDMRGLEQNITKLDEENRSLKEKINLASVFVAAEIKLAAVVRKGSKESETSSARKAEKFVLSFLVQNHVNQYSDADVYVVITAPDGQVLQSSVWESKAMDTKGEGKKPYTLRIRFDYEKGEAKRLIFSLDPDQFLKGNYTMQIYHNGYRIGQVIKSLS
jgi:predicted  nucleic acid-binding Zn-ribbon protein